MRIVYALVLIAGLGAVVADHLTSPSIRARGLAGGFRRRLRALRRAVSVGAEEIAVASLSSFARNASTSARVGAPRMPP